MKRGRPQSVSKAKRKISTSFTLSPDAIAKMDRERGKDESRSAYVEKLIRGA